MVSTPIVLFICDDVSLPNAAAVQDADGDDAIMAAIRSAATRNTDVDEHAVTQDHGHTDTEIQEHRYTDTAPKKHGDIDTDTQKHRDNDTDTPQQGHPDTDTENHRYIATRSQLRACMPTAMGTFSAYTDLTFGLESYRTRAWDDAHLLGDPVRWIHTCGWSCPCGRVWSIAGAVV